jgi:deoxyribonuclease-4
MSLIGIHISDISDIMALVKSNNEKNVFKNINLVQVFISATTNYLDKKYESDLKFIRDNKITLVVHGSYSINLSRRWTTTDWWILQFIGEIKASEQIKAFGIVIHTGKKLDLSDSEAINNMYTALLYVHHNTEIHNHVKIIIETASGQGSETLTKIEDLCKFMNKFYSHPDKKVRERFGICIDTCHIFAAGHDIRNEKDMNKFFGSIENAIGINKIKLCQINDSKKGLGSKLDRHENIGYGEIGKEPILRVTKFMKKLEIPIVLETPSEHLEEDYLLLTNA